MLKKIQKIAERNRERRRIEALPTSKKLERMAAMAAKPAIEAVAFDESLQYVTDTYSPVGSPEDKKYLHTTTHRGPGRVPLFSNEGTPHAKSFVFSDGFTTRLYRREVHKDNGKNVLGVSEYSITKPADGEPSVTQKFHSTRDASLLAITLEEGQLVKEFQEDAGLLEPKQLEEVAWLERQSGLLTATQRYEMSLVGFALDVVGSHPDVRHQVATAQ
ncbi:hypothetical protein EYC59_03225 [Candidatus Saccharibacteria bacterium]|nr:MAG: hypothetical protein EYC59_03225 [Candidatus Saccharibacteria bacterium]